jgi:hypothetical protein
MDDKVPPLVIHEGSHTEDTSDPKTRRIGLLPTAEGGTVEVFADNIAEAYTQAIGPVPTMPLNLLGMGQLKPTYGQIETNTFGLKQTMQVITGYTYDQGPADYDRSLVAGYQAAVQAWNDHATQVKSIMDVILSQLKESVLSQVKESK